MRKSLFYIGNSPPNGKLFLYPTFHTSVLCYKKNIISYSKFLPSSKERLKLRQKAVKYCTIWNIKWVMWYKCKDWKDERPKGNSNFMYACDSQKVLQIFYMMHAASNACSIHIYYGRHILKAYEGNVSLKKFELFFWMVNFNGTKEFSILCRILIYGMFTQRFSKQTCHICSHNVNFCTNLYKLKIWNSIYGS